MFQMRRILRWTKRNAIASGHAFSPLLYSALVLFGISADLRYDAPLSLFEVIVYSHSVSQLCVTLAVALLVALLAFVLMRLADGSRDTAFNALARYVAVLLLAISAVLEVVLIYVIAGNLVNVLERQLSRQVAYRLPTARMLEGLLSPFLPLLKMTCVPLAIILGCAIPFNSFRNAFVSISKRFLKIALFLLAIILTLFTMLFITVEFEYPRKVEGLKNSMGGECTLDKAWELVKNFSKSFTSTYKTIWPKPRQFVLNISELKTFMFKPSKVFAAKLAAVSGTGACEDFALGAAQLLSDVLGCETRVVAFLGEDHALPEVKVGDAWYVVDIAYTTPESPVKVSEYAEHLKETKPSLYSKIKGVIEAYTGRDLSAEHGFAAKGG
jgi:hypothetical protein